MLVRLFVLAGLALSCPVLAQPLEGKIIFNEHLANISSIRPSTSVSLDHGAQYAYILKDGSFKFPEVEPGLHTLQVLSSTHYFQELVLTLPPTTLISGAASPPTASPFVAVHNPSAVLPFDALSPPSVGSLPYPLELVPMAKLNFYTEQGSFQIFQMFKSPMMLMMLASGILMLGLPWMMKNIDPEALNEASKMMSGGGSLKTLPARSSDDDLDPSLPSDKPATVLPPYSFAAATAAGGGKSSSGGKNGKGGGGKKKK